MKVQKEVALIKKQQDSAGKSRAALEKEKEQALRKQAKLEEEKRLKEEAALTRPVQAQKVPFGVDPKTVLCAFFKAGQCEKGIKCKFSHDLDVGRKVEKRNLYGGGEDEKLEGPCHSLRSAYLTVLMYKQTQWTSGMTKNSVVSSSPSTETLELRPMFVVIILLTTPP
jgi:hypothetical protein